jgi:general secretion pathway protein J
MTPVRPRRRRKGFTLLEVMVAVFVTAMVLTIVYNAFGRTIESKEYVEKGNEAYHKIRWAMDKITLDLASAYVLRDKNSNSIFYGVSHMVGSMPMDEIHFTSFSHIRSNPEDQESHQAEISYKVAWIPDDESFQLWRREDATVDFEPQSGGEEYLLLDGVMAFNLRFYDGVEWREDWDSRPIELLAEAQEEAGGEEEGTEVQQTDEMVQAVPVAVEVSLAVMGADGSPIVFVSKVRLELSTIDLSAEDTEDTEGEGETEESERFDDSTSRGGGGNSGSGNNGGGAFLGVG